METKKCCGTCRFNFYDKYEKDFTCDNDKSDGYGCQTAYDDYCEEYEGKVEVDE